MRQAERCREALANIYFDQCFSSPICRAKVWLIHINDSLQIYDVLSIISSGCSLQSTAEVIWQGREGPLVFLDSLEEAHLFFLEGMKNGASFYFTCSSSKLGPMHSVLKKLVIFSLNISVLVKIFGTSIKFSWWDWVLSKASEVLGTMLSLQSLICRHYTNLHSVFGGSGC